MDEFFDKIKDGASKAKDSAGKIAKEVAKRTTKAITHTKLAFAVNETQNKVKDIYSEIGKEIYAQHLEGADFGEYFADYFDQLDKLMEEIEMINSKMAELKNSLKCPECGAYNSNDSEFCSKCGAHIKDKDVSDDKDDIEDAFNAAEDDEEEVIVINPKKPE